MAENLKFGKGIGVAAGFDLGAQKPLDSRYTVADIEERDAHVEGNRAYEGMLVFVEADKKTYQYLNGAWVEFGFNNAKLEAEIVDNLESDEATKILSAKQGKVLKGLIDAEATAARAAEKANADAIDAIEADYLKAADMAAEVTARNAAIKVTDDKVVELAGTHATDKAALEAAIALKADQTALEAVSGVANAAATKTELEEAVEALEAEDDRIEGLVTAEATKAREEEGKLANRIKTVEDDYLKAADKTELQGKITANANAIELLTNGVSAEEVDGVNDLIQYVKDHGTEVTGMKADISANTKAIADHVVDYEAYVLTQKATDEAQDAKIKALEDKFGEGEGSVEDMVADAQAAAEAKAATLATEAKEAAIAAAATDATTKANAAQTAAEATAAADATAKANAAEAAAKSHAEAKASAAQAAAEAKAKELADAATDVANAAQEAADKAQEEVDAVEGRMTTAESEIDTLQSEMDAVEAKALANEQAIATLNGGSDVAGSVANSIAAVKAEAATDAQTKANTAEQNAKNYADGKFNEVVTTNTNQQQEIDALEGLVGSGKVDDRIATAKQEAIDAAATDATNKADAAQAAAEATAAADATAKANAALAAAKEDSSNKDAVVLAEAQKGINNLANIVNTKANDADLAAIAKTGSTDDLIQGNMVLVFDCGTSAV